jgi:Ser/Thr protein kinase RdoA (MazF antagonist)
VLTEYKPKAHNIDYLGKLAGKLQPSLRDVFPRTAPEDKRVWDLLKKAYIDARYSTKFVVTAEELEVMARRVRDLRERVERVCRDRIEGA